ncbi:GntR family transcriptional regulator [Collinsella sp. AGMB00827]|uniref:GntR family transcriptional regulator n=1 Tax=Collinsella ureilytica TaxID=2869515 RepID=A0ABS7MKB9_9ACTN|nr:GntR family transcriptional regulator [Collinsella urealyticum]MBY4797758.1 GntR family transcriptional regulator [Collinsella urealyticum]
MQKKLAANCNGCAQQAQGDRDTEKLLYLQLADFIREKVYAKEWRAGDRIPSEHALMSMFEVARGTVRKALKLLVDEGMLHQVRGSGTYVSEPGIAHPVGGRPLSFADSLKAQGKDFTTRVVDQWIGPASDDVASALKVPIGCTVMFMRRVRSVDNIPIICQESWLNLRECAGLQDIDYTQESLFNAVQQCSKRKIKTSDMRYTARVAGSEHGELLDCDESAALLMLEQVISLEDGTPIEWCSTWFTPGQSVVGTAVQPD